MNISADPISILRDQINALVEYTIALFPNLVAAIVVITLTMAIALIVGKVLTSILRRSQTRPSLVDALSKLARLGVWLVGLLIAAAIIFPNLTPTKLLAGLGIGSIAIGLAFKDIFENFLAGFLILLRKPMRIGDDIECEHLQGRVEQISIRDTFLRKRSGELLLVPNSFLFKNPVNILTDGPLRRISLVVGVAYDEDIDEARKVITNAVDSLKTSEDGRPVQVFAREFNASSIDFMVRWWTRSAPPDEHVSRDEAVAAIKRALDDAGIAIPFPHRTLTFPETLQVDLRKPDGQG